MLAPERAVPYKQLLYDLWNLYGFRHLVLKENLSILFLLEVNLHNEQPFQSSVCFSFLRRFVKHMIFQTCPFSFRKIKNNK